MSTSNKMCESLASGSFVAHFVETKYFGNAEFRHTGWKVNFTRHPCCYFRFPGRDDSFWAMDIIGQFSVVGTRNIRQSDVLAGLLIAVLSRHLACIRGRVAWSRFWLFFRRRPRLTPASSPELPFLKHFLQGFVQPPVAAFAWVRPRTRDLHKAFVEREVVPDAVLPAAEVLAIVGKVRLNVLVDPAQCDPLSLRLLDRHRDQRHIRVGRFLISGVRSLTKRIAVGTLEAREPPRVIKTRLTTHPARLARAVALDSSRVRGDIRHKSTPILQGIHLCWFSTLCLPVTSESVAFRAVMCRSNYKGLPARSDHPSELCNGVGRLFTVHSKVVWRWRTIARSAV